MFRKRRIPIIRPRVKLHKSGSITLTGIDYKDLRSIFTAASLYRYDHPVNSEYKDELEWERRIKYVIEQVEKGIGEEINKTFPWHNSKKTIEQRMNEVKEEKAFRLRLEQLFEDLRIQHVQQMQKMVADDWKIVKAIQEKSQ